MTMEWLTYLGLFLPFILYAEIHFRLPLLSGLLYRKEPEILFDMPFRSETGKSIPVFLFVKDAHLFPVKLLHLTLTITHRENQKTYIQNEELDCEIKEKFFNRIFPIDSRYTSESGKYEITAELQFLTSNGKKKSISQDNYSRIPHPPFTLHISAEKFTSDKNWYWGDLHNHSLYTNDQVEFGAPIEFMTSASRTMGLDFLAITDHSYDLDDRQDDFLENDPGIEKWHQFQAEVKEIQEQHPELILIPGEEISAGNHINKNIHCLLLNDPRFFPGCGDSAERLWKNRPTLPLSEILKKKSAEALAIAAHPLEKPPLSQQIILNRGWWNLSDVKQPGLDALQILNGNNRSLLKAGIDLWKNLLLDGQKVGIVAGSDSHGNFNCFRQISIPFLKMVFSRNHLFGSVKTGVRLDRFTLTSLLDGIRNHQTVISNGPFACLHIPGNETLGIGNTIKRNSVSQLTVSAESTSEYGFWNELSLFWGNYKNRHEIKQSLTLGESSYTVEFDIQSIPERSDYVRLEAYSSRESLTYFCITSPIWMID